MLTKLGVVDELNLPGELLFVLLDTCTGPAVCLTCRQLEGV